MKDKITAVPSPLPSREDGAETESVPKLTLVPGAGRSFTLDKTDERILELLADDGRAAFLSIAGLLGVDEKTIRYRVAKMRSAGLLMFQPTLNPNQLENCVIICLGVKLTAQAKKNVEQEAQALANLPQVVWCGTILGAYDILVEVALESFEQVRDFQLSALSDMPSIETVETFVVLSHHGRRGIPIMPKSQKWRD